MFRRIPISDTQVWENTLSQWITDTQAMGDEGVFLTFDIEQRLNGLKQLTESQKNLHGYFLVKTGNNFASSVLEIAHALPGSEKSWLKLLNITLQPSLLPIGDCSQEKFKEIFSVLGYSIAHAIGLIFEEHPSAMLKIYGRNPEMVNLFKAIISTGVLDTALDAAQLAARIEGGWLVIAKIEA